MKEETKSVAKILKKLRVEFDGVFFSVKDKKQKCEELGIDVIIDDAPENVEKFLGTNIEVLYLRDSKMKTIVAKNVKSVDSWMSIYREIKKLDEKRN